jgi:tyrosinase
VKDACLQTRFEDFSDGLEQASREFRAWVGGHIKDDDFAAYDPLFWFHHANLDRIWANWQQAHPNSFPEQLSNVTMEPFAVKLGAIVNCDRLGYIYGDAPPTGVLIDKRA